MPKFLNLIQYVDDGADWETNPNDNTSGLRTIKLSQHNKPGTTIMRDSNGRAEISDPINNLDIANKGYIDDKWDNFPLTTGNGEYSVVQKRINSKGNVVHTEAYQRGAAAFGGGTVAGKTFAEWSTDNSGGTEEQYLVDITKPLTQASSYAVIMQ